MSPDNELLARYAQDRNDAAFAEVVHRYVDVAYSAALRLVGGDRHLAEDVTQTVFTELARQAEKLSRRATVAGWVHTTARYCAINVVRRERRRRIREQEAQAMQINSPTEQVDWSRLQPVLDDAVAQLKTEDSDAVVLRFFQNKSHREIGLLLGLSEEAARKRVDRAVEKLRAHFSRRGIAISAGLLAETVGANSVQAAPAALAAGVVDAALVNASAVSTTGILYPLLHMTTKTKITLGLAALLLVPAVITVSLMVSRQKPAINETAVGATTQPAAAKAPGAATSLKMLASVETPKAAPAKPSGTALTTATATAPARKPGEPIKPISIEYDATGKMLLDLGDVALPKDLPQMLELPTGEAGTMMASITPEGTLRVDIRIKNGNTHYWAMGDPPSGGETPRLSQMGWGGSYGNGTKQYSVSYSAHLTDN